MCAERTSMGFVNMETTVTLDMRNKFAMTTTVKYLHVKRDIQESVVGSMSMEDVNLHHIVKGKGREES